MSSTEQAAARDAVHLRCAQKPYQPEVGVPEVGVSCCVWRLPH